MKPVDRERFKFPRSARLSRSLEFHRVKAQGRTWNSRCLVLGVWRSGTLHPPRIGIITSRRVGGAVIRNRIRRQIREIFRRHQHHLLPGSWLVTIARAAAAAAKFRDLESEWLRLVERASIHRGLVDRTVRQSEEGNA